MKSFFLACAIAAITTFSGPAGSAASAAPQGRVHAVAKEPGAPSPVLGIFAILAAVALARRGQSR